MRLWVTGARGFIGRHVVAQARTAGHEVWALSRRPVDGVGWTTLDLADSGRVSALARATAPDAIIHLAWYAQPNDYLVAVDNVDALTTTLSFARAVLDGGCQRMVGVGTCVEYADAPRAREETDPIAPSSLYARCKHAAHLVLAELFARRGASLAWARLFHMHGPGEHPARLIPAVARALREGREFALSPGEQLRDHLDVRDVASALLHLAVTPLDGAVNVCSGRPISLRALLEIVGRQLGRADLLVFGARPYQAGEVMNLTGNPERLMTSGFRPVHGDLAASLEQSIAATAPTL